MIQLENNYSNLKNGPIVTYYSTFAYRHRQNIQHSNLQKGDISIRDQEELHYIKVPSIEKTLEISAIIPKTI